MTIYVIGTASGGGPIVPGPLITVGPVIIMLGELIKIELGKERDRAGTAYERDRRRGGESPLP